MWKSYDLPGIADKKEEEEKEELYVQSRQRCSHVTHVLFQIGYTIWDKDPYYRKDGKDIRMSDGTTVTNQILGTGHA